MGGIGIESDIRIKIGIDLYKKKNVHAGAAAGINYTGLLVAEAKLKSRQEAESRVEFGTEIESVTRIELDYEIGTRINSVTGIVISHPDQDQFGASSSSNLLCYHVSRDKLALHLFVQRIHDDISQSDFTKCREVGLELP
ncbi:hypothetical protein EVAR_66237_1 [Eumeta japonica]|uniref:Uncharacterized protein n=1 Tax=Eumeta variegata TaxID=151549 RepID=A0A4C1ZZB8_EUMVA|nr:hypothetical protein EVAR_66237_1 [Eumeta japonica]